MISSAIDKNNVECDYSINNKDNVLISNNELTKNLLLKENINTTAIYYERLEEIGISICQGNELLFYNIGYDLEEKQYKAICYQKNPLKFKYFSLNTLVGITS